MAKENILNQEQGKKGGKEELSAWSTHLTTTVEETTHSTNLSTE